ncbi:VCBS repeat-containing protein [bacterium]|nr:VCBS repeat-containing protein [bacterium]
MIAKKVFFLAIFFLAVSLLFGQWPVRRCQSDWHSGAGLSDTTDEWGERYFSGGGINDAVVPLMLLADPASYDYTNWTSHTIDNSTEIGTFNWCVRPALINDDDIPDIVANLSDNADAATARVVWYEGPATGWAYTRHDIYTYTAVDRVAGAFPADIDNDGDIDIVAGDNMSLNWFENDGTGGGWTRHTIYTTSAMQYSAWYYDVADADGDGWKDILVTEVEPGFLSTSTYCTIYWNTGTGPDYFDASSSIVLSSFTASDGQFWRAVFFDPDPTDGFLDVAYEKVSYTWFGTFGDDSLIIVLQGPARSFSYAYSHYIDAASTGMEQDGLWANDFDDDGDQDLVVGVLDEDFDSPGYFFLIQSDPGDVFSYHFLVNDPNSTYGDGAIMFDMDNDGMADIVGTCDSVGYFRRTGTGYTDFTLYSIDNVPGTSDTTHFASHWVYPYNMDRGECSGDADIDLLITFDNRAGDQELRIYENEMFRFVPAGSLYSAILGIPLPSDTCVVCSLYWEGCQIPEYTISIAGRVGESVSDCQSAAWGTVSNNPYHETGYDHGWYAGAIHTPVDTIWVQYYINFNRSGGTVDLSPLIDSVWVKVFPIPCECEDIQAMWTCPTPCFSFSSCSTQVMQMLMWTDSTTIDTSQTFFTVDDGFTTYPLYEPSSNLSFVCLTPNCDSVFVEISNIPWTDGATVTISLDSAYTDDGCLTTWP